jgi:ligand-binding SRPBCC domain-containing protein
MSEIFKFRSCMPASAQEVYRFHAERDALERLLPPGQKARVIGRTGGIEAAGSRVTLRVSVGPFSQDWVSEHTACVPGKMFRDVMVSGPFPRWEHTHEFQSESPESSWLEDRVEYEFPFGWLGRLLGGAYTRRRLQRLFEWRHRATAEILAERKRASQGGKGCGMALPDGE